MQDYKEFFLQVHLFAFNFTKVRFLQEFNTMHLLLIPLASGDLESLKGGRGLVIKSFRKKEINDTVYYLIGSNCAGEIRREKVWLVARNSM